MTQEEKAKRFDETLEQLKGLIEGTREDRCAIVEEDIIDIFPELAESEDERIRKDLIQWFNEFPDTIWRGHYKKDILAWLEKQGKKEQDPCEHCNDKCLNCYNFPCIYKREYERGKSAMEAIKEENVDNANKVEPKFKVGDIIIKSQNSDINKFGKFKITGIKDGKYWYNEFVICKISEQDEWELVEQKSTKWTEEDERCIDNCCLLIGAADDCYEKTFKDDCIHYLQSLKEKIAWKPMPIKQKDLDNLVFNFKWSSENFKNKRVTDIYRQGIYDVMELLKQRM